MSLIVRRMPKHDAHEQDQTTREKKPPLRGGSFVSLSLRLGLVLLMGDTGVSAMVLIFAHPCNVFCQHQWTASEGSEATIRR